MPIHTKSIQLSSDSVVRDVDAMEGMPITSEVRSRRPGKWSTLLVGAVDGGAEPWGKTLKLTSSGGSPNDASIDSDLSGFDNANGGFPIGTAPHQTFASELKLIRLFAYNSTTRMYTKLVINHPLLPGEEIEISAYINRGFRLYDAHSPVEGGGQESQGGGPGEDTDFVGIISCSATDGTVSLNEQTHDPETNGLAATNRLTSFLTRPSYSVSKDTTYSTTTTQYRGDGDLESTFITDASDGSNLGITTGGWQYSDHRNDTSYTQAKNSGGSSDETSAKLFRNNTIAHPSQNQRFFRIKIRNDTQDAHYLAILPFNPGESTYEYWLLYDLRIKVTSAGGSEGSSGNYCAKTFPALRTDSRINMGNKRITGIEQIPDGSVAGALMPWKRINDSAQKYQYPHVIHVSSGVDLSKTTYPHVWLNMQNRILKFHPDSPEYGAGNNAGNSARVHRGFGYLVQRAGVYSQVTVKTANIANGNFEVILGYWDVAYAVGTYGDNASSLPFVEVCRFMLHSTNIEPASAPFTSTTKSSGNGQFPAESILCGYVIPTDYTTDEFFTMSIVIMLDG